METTRRIFAKSITWQAMGFISMTLAGLAFTGSVSASTGIAITGAIMGMIGYIAHEFIWSRVNWGRQHAPSHVPFSQLAEETAVGRD